MLAVCRQNRTNVTANTAAPALAAPSLKVRLACMVYEAMLLFGVLFVATWIFSTTLDQRHALSLRGALQDWLFAVLGLYFGWFWTHGGQTLAMKTWRIRLVDRHGAPVGWGRALLRYLLSWLWLLPGLGIAYAVGARGWTMVWIPALNMLLWALASWASRERQFLHDRLAGTRLVALPPPHSAPVAAP